MDKKQQWIDYHKKVKSFKNAWFDYDKKCEKYIKSFKDDGTTHLDPPKPPLENPPPPPNPE